MWNCRCLFQFVPTMPLQTGWLNRCVCAAVIVLLSWYGVFQDGIFIIRWFKGCGSLLWYVSALTIQCYWNTQIDGLPTPPTHKHDWVHPFTVLTDTIWYISHPHMAQIALFLLYYDVELYPSKYITNLTKTLILVKINNNVTKLNGKTVSFIKVQDMDKYRYISL